MCSTGASWIPVQTLSHTEDLLFLITDHRWIVALGQREAWIDLLKSSVMWPVWAFTGTSPEGTWPRVWTSFTQATVCFNTCEPLRCLAGGQLNIRLNKQESLVRLRVHMQPTEWDVQDVCMAAEGSCTVLEHLEASTLLPSELLITRPRLTGGNITACNTHTCAPSHTRLGHMHAHTETKRMHTQSMKWPFETECMHAWQSG